MKTPTQWVTPGSHVTRVRFFVGSVVTNSEFQHFTRAGGASGGASGGAAGVVEDDLYTMVIW